MSEPLASPAPSQIEPGSHRPRELSRIWRVYRPLLAVSRVSDIRQVVRRRDGPLGGATRRPAQPDSRQELSAPAVDPVTGKCRPGKVSRTVSTSPLTLDMTVVCTPDPDLLQPGAVAQGVLPADTVNKSVTGFDTSTPLVATPAIVVGQQIPQVKDFPTLNLSKSSELLPSFGLSSSFSSPMLPWGMAEDSSPSFSPNRVREGHSQNVPSEGSLFNVLPLSPELVIRPTREGGVTQPEGVLLPTMLEDFNDSVLGDPISYVGIPTITAYVRMPTELGLHDGLGHSDCVGAAEVRKASGGDLSHGGESQGGQIGAAGLSVQILGVRRTPVYRWKPGI